MPCLFWGYWVMRALRPPRFRLSLRPICQHDGEQDFPPKNDPKSSQVIENKRLSRLDKWNGLDFPKWGNFLQGKAGPRGYPHCKDYANQYNWF